MNGYLLDTNICAYFFRNKFGIKEKMESINPENLFISEITYIELYYGCIASGRFEENLYLLNSLCKRIKIIDIRSCIRLFAEEKYRLRIEGTPIDNFDLLIGTTALSNNLILVTDNVKHMSRIKGLIIQNWIKRIAN